MDERQHPTSSKQMEHHETASTRVKNTERIEQYMPEIPFEYLLCRI